MPHSISNTDLSFAEEVKDKISNAEHRLRLHVFEKIVSTLRLEEFHKAKNIMKKYKRKLKQRHSSRKKSKRDDNGDDDEDDDNDDKPGTSGGTGEGSSSGSGKQSYKVVPEAEESRGAESGGGDGSNHGDGGLKLKLRRRSHRRGRSHSRLRRLKSLDNGHGDTEVMDVETENNYRMGSQLCEGLVLKAKESKDYEFTQGIYNILVQLIEQGLIGLEQVYTLLSPQDLEINENWSETKKATVKYALDSMKVRIGGNGNGDPNNADENLDNYMSLFELFQTNQKIHLLQTFVDFGMATQVLALLKRYPKYALTSIGPVGKSIGLWINFLIDSLYRSVADYPNLPADAPVLGKPPYFALSNMSTIPPQTYPEFNLTVVPIIIQLGPYIYHVPEVFSKLLRIFKHYLTTIIQNNLAKDGLYYNIITILGEGFLPGLSCLDANSGITNDIWELVKLYSYEVRFMLYSTWKSESLVTAHPVLLTKQADLTKQLKQLVKRLSKENVKAMSRKLVKMTLTMPVVVLDYILVQVQLFDNLIPPLIDTLVYLSDLGRDIIVYCLLEVLCPSPVGTSSSPESKALSMMLTPNRSRTKHDGMTISSWMQHIASFSGALCQRYPINIVPLLQFIANQLKDKQSLDLMLLNNIIYKMSGFEVSEQITNDHLNAQSGGVSLKLLAGYYGKINPNMKCVERLSDALKQKDLAQTLCTLMAQQRDKIVFGENSNELHVKLVGGLYDQCQATLVQLGTFLSSSLDIAAYRKLFPSLENLLESYKVVPEVAFFLWRPIITAEINEKYTNSLLIEAEKLARFCQPVTIERQARIFSHRFKDAIDPIVKIFRNRLDSKLWDVISPELYVTFWSLHLSDIRVPHEAYKLELERNDRERAALRTIKLPETDFLKQKDKLLEEEKTLQREKSSQASHVERVMIMLEKEKVTWFPERQQIAGSSKSEFISTFLETCISKRLLFSSLDALYAAEFLKVLHRIKAPNFPSLSFYDHVLGDINLMVGQSTANEASRYGRFLSSLLDLTLHWHSSPSIFAKECSNYPGFLTKFKGTFYSQTTLCSGTCIDYETYRHMCYKWQYKLTICVANLLESGDFLLIRNCLLVLTTVIPSYPKITHFAKALERRVMDLQAKEKDNRQDLYVLATSYLGQLKKQLQIVIPEVDFHIKITRSPQEPQQAGGGKRFKPNEILVNGSVATSKS